VRDKSPDADAYSKPLATRIQDYLPQMPVVEVISTNPGVIQHAADQIARQRPDLVIFCGYPSVFQPLVLALRSQFSASGRPRLLLTDGAKSKNLNVEPFEAWLTYPIPRIADGPYPPWLRDDISKNHEDEYEIYAYDAMCILGQAISTCKFGKKGIVSRSCVLNELRSNRCLVGSAGIYSFVAGSNPLAPYYVYHVTGNQYKYDQAVEPFALQKFKQDHR
jgi:hypothetical protein